MTFYLLQVFNQIFRKIKKNGEEFGTGLGDDQQWINKDFINIIIGKRGSNINLIKRINNVDITVEPEHRERSNVIYKKITVKGDFEVDVKNTILYLQEYNNFTS